MKNRQTYLLQTLNRIDFFLNLYTLKDSWILDINQVIDIFHWEEVRYLGENQRSTGEYVHIDRYVVDDQDTLIHVETMKYHIKRERKVFAFVVFLQSTTTM